MDNPHSIADLLNGGAEPTQAEVSDLTSLGRFVSRLLARHIGGDFQTLFQTSIGVQPERMGRAFADAAGGFPLAAETGTRWDRPMGIGAAMLEPMSGRYWQPDSSPRFMASLIAELGELTTVALGEPSGQPVARLHSSPVGSKGSSSRSLFGAPTTPVVTERTMSWAGTGEVAPAALAALSNGGLPLADQLRVADSPAGRRSPRASVVLDGMAIDQRTPALTAALLQSTNMVSDRGLGGEVVNRHQNLAGPRVSEPVYGLYDAAETSFVGLSDVDAAEIRRPSRVPSPREAPGSSRLGLDQVVPARPGGATIATGSTPLRPWTAAEPKTTEVAASPILVASQVTHDHHGRSVPMTARGGIAGERAQIVRLESPSTGVATPAASTGLDGADRAAETAAVIGDNRSISEQPRFSMEALGASIALPGRELRAPSSPVAGFVAALEERRWQEAPAAEGFRPVAAGRATTPTTAAEATPGALDDGIWLALSGEEGRPDITTSEVAAGIPEGASPPPARGDTQHVHSGATGVRAALQRPVITAREVLAAAPWMASLARASATAAPDRTALPALVQWMEGRREKLGPGAEVRDLTVRSELAQVVSSAPAPLVKQLQVAGWTQPEIARVLLALPDGPPPPVSTVDEATPTRARTAESGQVQPAGTQDQATAGMARSLARILTGTEALSAPPASSEPAGLVDLGGDAESYFGGAAPGRSAVETAGLREAIGELLGLAQRSIGALGARPAKEREAAQAQLVRVMGRMSAVADIPVRSDYVDASTDQRTWVDLSAHQEPTTLATRLTAALEASGRGPAGLERLVTALSTRGATGASIEEPASQPSATGVGLAATLAPDAMLQGLTGHRRRSAREDRSLPGTLIGLGHEEALPSGGRHHGLADFSGSWLRRVDGTRVGIDLGMDDTRAAFQETFAGFGSSDDGAQMDLAATSPIEDASVVVPGGPSSDGGQQRSHERTSGRRSRPRASTSSPGPTSSAQRADWSWVNTSSRKTGGATQGDTASMMQGLSDGRSGMGSEAMPLIAPSMHAVSQAAMRSANTEEAPGQQTAAVTSRETAGTGQESQAAQELSKEAFEELASRMAERISRRMRREKDRRGQWT